jgi:hypothetical protein
MSNIKEMRKQNPTLIDGLQRKTNKKAMASSIRKNT